MRAAEKDDALEASTPRRRLLEALRLDEGHNRGGSSACTAQALHLPQRQDQHRTERESRDEDSLDMQISQLVRARLAFIVLCCCVIHTCTSLSPTLSL